MYSFLISILALVLGYFIYGRFVEKVFGPDPNRVTPAVSKEDGIDYIAMPSWKVFMIQFLNIAGTGPIFGAIMGAKFGPSCYLWIVLGAIFAGGVHDYFSGMLSIRHEGVSFPNIVGIYLGSKAKTVLLVIVFFLILLVGTVFVYSPALIIGDLIDGGERSTVIMVVGVIFLYYVLATVLPIDKLIGRFYPIFAFSLLFMAVALMICLFVKWPSIPEVWDGLKNLGESKGFVGMKGQTVFPYIFVTIACGALSGFHATQSPIMSRCLKNEKMGRPVFYGAMITEGIVALIWAAVASYFFFDGGAEAVGADINSSAPVIVNKVSKYWLGAVGGILAILGVVAAPITSGDTVFRSARLMIADTLNIDQKPKSKRILIVLPLFAVTLVFLWFNIAHEDGFNILWRYFGWANQLLASFILWTAAVWLTINRKGLYYLIALVPAVFTSSVCISYLCVSKIGFNLSGCWAVWITFFSLALCLFLFYSLKKRNDKMGIEGVAVKPKEKVHGK